MNQRLIDANKLSAKLHLKYGFGPSAEFMQELIDEAPTIEAAPVVHARWVHPSPYPLGEGGDPYCSNCKKTAPWFPLNGYYEPDCCPHCGANMDLKEVRS